VQVYQSRDAVRTLTEDDTLEGEGPLEGFALDLHTLFA